MKIIAAGYSGFNEHYKSNHLAILVNFNINDILGIREKTTPSSPKPLRVDHPPSRDTLNKRVWKTIYKMGWASELEK